MCKCQIIPLPANGSRVVETDIGYPHRLSKLTSFISEIKLHGYNWINSIIMAHGCLSAGEWHGNRTVAASKFVCVLESV